MVFASSNAFADTHFPKGFMTYNLFSEIKKAILCSKQLVQKNENFSKFLIKHQGKDYDDFSFLVRDSFEVELISNSDFTNYEIVCGVSDSEPEKSTLSNIIESELESFDFDDSLLKFYLSLKVKKHIHLTINFEFLVGYVNEKDSFVLRKNKNGKSKNEFVFVSKKIPGLFEVVSTNNYSIGFVNSLAETAYTIDRLNKLKAYFCELNEKIKHELHLPFYELKWYYGKCTNTCEKSLEELQSIIRTIVSNDSIVLSESSDDSQFSEIVEYWLDANCDSSVRNLISCNQYNIYHSNSVHEQWITIVDFLSEDSEFQIMSPS